MRLYLIELWALYFIIYIYIYIYIYFKRYQEHKQTTTRNKSSGGTSLSLQIVKEKNRVNEWKYSLMSSNHVSSKSHDEH
jgi:hypothetical protein